MEKSEKEWKGWERWENVEKRWKKVEKVGKDGKVGKGEKNGGLYFAFIHSSARESAKCCQHQMRSNLCQQLIRKKGCFIDSKIIRNVLQ